LEIYHYLESLGNLLPDIPADSIISRSVLKNEQVDITLFGFAEGQELTEHTSSRPAILYFVNGKARLTLGKDEKTAEKETMVYMPPRLPHSIFAETPVTMLLILLRV
jgi:quercetin dioxygenase-like cupin family protein